MNHEVFEKVLKISEEFFGTGTDPDQMPVTKETADTLFSIHHDTVLYKFDESGNPIAWSVIVPTSVEVMNKFLNKEISEKELLAIAAQEKRFDALYLCAVFVLPEYRRQGYAKQLLLDGVTKISNGRQLPLYCWIYSDEGKRLIHALAQEFGREIVSRAA